MRRIPLLNVTQTGANPGTFTVGTLADNPSGDWTSVFRGKYYRDSVGNTLEFYTSATTPAGYSLIEATTFSVVDNPSYSGRYTVYTQPSAGGLASSTFGSGQTTVRVNEPLGTPGSPADLTAGYITNVSTYYLVRVGDTAIVVPPGVDLTSLPLELVGRGFSGWGEVFQQNLLRAVQNFAGGSAPSNPLVGQNWLNTTDGIERVWNGTAWTVVNSAAFAPASSFRHVQTSAAATWTISHNLNTPSPFLVNASFFVDTGGGVYKPILPSDVTYVDANTITVTFTVSHTGYALIRP